MKKGMHKIILSISCLTLCMSFFIVPVFAESDIYYPNPNSYNCYEFFFSSGYDHLILSSSSNITYNVNLNNNGTNNGSITGTDNMTGSSHNTGTINSTSSTLGSKYMTCTTNNAVSGTQTYSCYFSNVSYGQSNSQSITLKMNENTYSDYSNVDIGVNESIKQTIDTDITGTLTSSNSSYSYIYLPWLHGTYNSTKKYIWLDGNQDTFYILFITKSRIRNNDYTGLYLNADSSLNVEYDFSDRIVGNLVYNNIRIHRISGGGNIAPVFQNLTNQDVLPMFYGYEFQLDDDTATLFGWRPSIGTLLNNGNKYTSSNVTDASNANYQVEEKIGQFDSLESNSVTNMNSKISNLNLTSDILSNSKFLSSAQWVKNQFDRMTVSTPIGSVLSFSLILGITLIFLGKIR